MLYIKLCCGFLLTTASYFVMADDMAKDRTSYDKCEAIKNASDKVNCYYSTAKELTEKYDAASEPRENKANLGEANRQVEQIAVLNKNIQAMLNIAEKGALETTKEYMGRIQKLREKYDNRTYKIAFDVKKFNSDEHGATSYDPDTETLTVSMPELELGDFFMSLQTYRSDYVYYSFLNTRPFVYKVSSYSGRNGFGNEIKVTKLESTYIGIAITGRCNRNMTPQRFTTTMTRDLAGEFLKRGKIIITVKTELLPSVPYRQDLLISKYNSRKPTMNDPKDVNVSWRMLPVRLISMSLVDGKGVEVFQDQGTEQDTPAIGCQRD